MVVKVVVKVVVRVVIVVVVWHGDRQIMINK